ncbi:MAG: NADH-quinone oxidoreductase subunit D [Micrococcales bacterium]|nr:NADH-quinone oxidoreductase subunit D [Micrococcales bacterium]
MSTTTPPTGTTAHSTGALHDADLDGVPVFDSVGEDWSQIAAEAARLGEERIVVNMGPQHPSTHGVLRLMLEIDGETVTEARAGIGYLHSGIEKTMEYRTWAQGVTLCTRMDYLAPLFQEAAYCLAVEKLLEITDDVPERASVIRVLVQELNRICSHMVFVGTGGNEMGATTVMMLAFQAREDLLEALELITGLRMNHGYVRPGGVAQDVPDDLTAFTRTKVASVRKYMRGLEDLLLENPIVHLRMKGTGYLSMAACMALGVTGPMLRATGLPYDVRKTQPYCGYETYDFDIPTATEADNFARMIVRMEEIYQSLRLVEQACDRLDATVGAPVMVTDKKIGWPAQMSVGPDGQGQSPEHVKEILGTSMESLVHHFKLVTEGFRVPPGQVWQTIEHVRGTMGVHLVSDGGTKPYRAHFRDPSFNNLQATSVICEGGQVADVVVSVASIDPVLGGVDR